jgi:hypothetical protein
MDRDGHRRTWPKGLRLIFWAAVISLPLSIGQMIYWAFVTHEFFPELTMQGGYALIAFALGMAGLVAGVLSKRRLFVLLAFVTAAVHIGFTAYFNLDLFGMLLQDLLAGRWRLLSGWDMNTWIYHWNCLTITVNAAICAYLVRYEFRTLIASFGVKKLKG